MTSERERAEPISAMDVIKYKQHQREEAEFWTWWKTTKFDVSNDDALAIWQAARREERKQWLDALNAAGILVHQIAGSDTFHISCTHESALREERKRGRELLGEALMPLAALIISGECTTAQSSLCDEIKQQIVSAHDKLLAELEAEPMCTKCGESETHKHHDYEFNDVMPYHKYVSKCPTCYASVKQPVTRCKRTHHSHTPSPCILCDDPWHAVRITEPEVGTCQSSASSVFGHSGGVPHEERGDCRDWVKAEAVAPEPKPPIDWAERIINELRRMPDERQITRMINEYDERAAPASQPGEAAQSDPEKLVEAARKIAAQCSPGEMTSNIMY